MHPHSQIPGEVALPLLCRMRRAECKKPNMLEDLVQAVLVQRTHTRLLRRRRWLLATQAPFHLSDAEAIPAAMLLKQELSALKVWASAFIHGFLVGVSLLKPCFSS